MGAHLVKLAVRDWAARITDTAFRVLITMAVTALDEANGPKPAATYYGGHELLGRTLSNERNGSPDSTKRRVVKAIAELIRLSAIKLIKHAYPGRHAVYLLTLDRAAEPPRSIDEGPVDKNMVN